MYRLSSRWGNSRKSKKENGQKTILILIYSAGQLSIHPPACWQAVPEHYFPPTSIHFMYTCYTNCRTYSLLGYLKCRRTQRSTTTKFGICIASILPVHNFGINFGHVTAYLDGLPTMSSRWKLQKWSWLCALVEAAHSPAWLSCEVVCRTLANRCVHGVYVMRQQIQPGELFTNCVRVLRSERVWHLPHTHTHVLLCS